MNDTLDKICLRAMEWELPGAKKISTSVIASPERAKQSHKKVEIAALCSQ
jgi:hypothetical protein